MAPFKFPINDWDGNGSTDDLYDIFMEKKVCDSFKTKEDENLFLDRSIVDGVDYNLSSDNEVSNFQLQSKKQNNFQSEYSSDGSNVRGVIFVIGVIMAILGFIMNLD